MKKGLLGLAGALMCLVGLSLGSTVEAQEVGSTRAEDAQECAKNFAFYGFADPGECNRFVAQGGVLAPPSITAAESPDCNFPSPCYDISGEGLQPGSTITQVYNTLRGGIPGTRTEVIGHVASDGTFEGIGRVFCGAWAAATDYHVVATALNGSTLTSTPSLTACPFVPPPVTLTVTFQTSFCGGSECLRLQGTGLLPGSDVTATYQWSISSTPTVSVFEGIVGPDGSFNIGPSIFSCGETAYVTGYYLTATDQYGETVTSNTVDVCSFNQPE